MDINVSIPYIQSYFILNIKGILLMPSIILVPGMLTIAPDVVSDAQVTLSHCAPLD